MTPAAIGAWALGLFLAPEKARKFALPGFIAVVVLAVLLAWSAIALGIALWERGIRSDERETIHAERVEGALEGERRAGKAGQARDEARRAAGDAAADDLAGIHAEDAGSRTRPASAGTRRVAERLPQGD